MQNTNSKLFNLIILTAFITLTIIAMFWQELVETLTDGTSSILSKDVVFEQMRDVDKPSVREVRFERARNNINQIQIGDITVVGHSDSSVKLSVRLSSISANNDYPALRVTVLSRTGEKLRASEIEPSDYVHGRVVDSEPVEIHVPIRPGDASFEIVPFYKE
jgi:hypothetical protein